GYPCVGCARRWLRRRWNGKIAAHENGVEGVFAGEELRRRAAHPGEPPHDRRQRRRRRKQRRQVAHGLTRTAELRGVERVERCKTHAEVVASQPAERDRLRARRKRRQRLGEEPTPRLAEALETPRRLGPLRRVERLGCPQDPTELRSSVSARARERTHGEEP